jgi:phage baseplate assembly protein W
MKNTELKSFLGKGWSFPPSFSQQTHSVEMVTEKEDICQSLFLLFSTSPGERLMKPEYGCDLHAVIFDNFDASTKSRLVDMITTSIVRFEPRIFLESINIWQQDPDEGRINIDIEFTIRITNTRDNIVFPFYFKEGNNIHNM